MVSKMSTFASICILSLVPAGLVAGSLCSKSSEEVVSIATRKKRYRPTRFERANAFVIINRTAKIWRLMPVGEVMDDDDLVDLKLGPAGKDRTFRIPPNGQVSLAFLEDESDQYQARAMIVDAADRTRAVLTVNHADGRTTIALAGAAAQPTANGQREHDVDCHVANRTLTLGEEAPPQGLGRVLVPVPGAAGVPAAGL